jgi:hypothetical protein
MAVDIYAELNSLNARLGAVEGKLAAGLASLEERIAKLEAAEVPATTLRVAPVSYFRADKLLPDGSFAWDAVIAKKPALAMINPGSGPGPTQSSSYTVLVAKAQAAGVPIYGYTHSQGPDQAYGTRPVAEIKADIDKHISWYGCQGIFIDCTSNKAEHVPYYAELCAYVHARGRKVILNPGTQSLEQHAQMADYVMISEGTLGTYKARVARAWEANYKNLWHCVHSCPEAEMPGVVHLAKQRGAGLLFVTERTLQVGCYNQLPVYWGALCTEVGS